MASSAGRGWCTTIPSLLGAPARLIAAEADGLSLLVLDAPQLYDRPGGPYVGPDGLDHPDNWRRFGALCRAAADVARGVLDGVRSRPRACPRLAGRPRARLPALPRHRQAVGHHHPQHRLPGLVPARRLRLARAAAAGLRARRRRVPRRRRLPEGRARLRRRHHHRQPDLRRGDHHRRLRHGARGPDRARARRSLHGIVNGIDTDVWNPETDPLLAAPFSARKLRDRAKNRDAVERRFGLHAGRLAASRAGQPADLAEGHRPAGLDHRPGHRPRRPASRGPRQRRQRAREHLPLARRRVPGPRRRRHRLRRAARRT